MSHKKKFELLYEGKEKKDSIIKNIKPIELNKIYTFKSNMNLLDNFGTNSFYFGENLRILRTLLDNPCFKGKINLIYIDPPFGTRQLFKGGDERTSTISSSLKDEIAYDDTLIGEEYIEFLRKRIILLYELLSNKGSIYVHIDSKMGYQVKLILDEIFGEQNFINDIIRIKCNPKNFSRRAYGNYKDLIFFYSKSGDYIWNDSLEEYTKNDIERLFPKKDRIGRRYATNPLHAPGETKNGETGKPWRGINPPKGRHWRYKPEILEELDEKGLIEWSSTGNPRKIIFADDHIKKKKKRQDIWEFKDPAYPSYPTEKNIDLLKTIIKASSNLNDMILDCFAGSGTTLIASEILGRKWIGIDNSLLAFEAFLKKISSINTSNFEVFNTTSLNLLKTIKKFI
ncbi:MAG: site-specific DNA-methyltransferase [Candidatus Lokiarchaeota archaeon]|nr:site-specific DNA-methyltransferase [Candidatus Lokiarchaeota archaeon]